eukprot:g5963.t1
MAEKEARLHGITIDEFFMYKYKVDACQKRYAHDWTSCFYAHSGESARRRDPSVYKPIPCPESKGGNPCPRGDACKYAHNDFEYWLHPARYKTEYCKQGPACNRKICFFAHRPEELRKAPNVVYTNQGPFLDSETTARNKQRVMTSSHGITSPWNVLANARSSSFNNGVHGDFSTMCNGLSSSSYSTGVADQTRLAALSQQMNLVSSSNGNFLHPCISHGQGFEEYRDNGGFISNIQRQNEESQTMNNIHNAMNALSLANSANLQPSFSDLSPLASHTPTTPWSATAASFPYKNPFCAEQFGNSELLTFLQGLQTHPLTQTPRSLTDELTAGSDTFPYSWSNDLINLAQMVSTEMNEESALCSSISDGAIYGNQHIPPLLTSTNTLPYEHRNGRI